MKDIAKELGTRLTGREALGLLGSVVGSVALAACFSDRPTDTDDDDGDDGEGTEVAMSDQLVFEPELLVIAAGETVVWRNTGNFVHTSTAEASKAIDPAHVRLPDGAEPWDSGDVSPGGTFSRRFDVPGEYHYFCIPHETQGMLGRIVVTS